MSMMIPMSERAADNVTYTGCDVAHDLASLRSGACTELDLLNYCLEEADQARVEGWRDYVEALVRASM